MRDLERELRDLGALLELPPTPDLRGPVRGRLGERPPAGRHSVRRRTLVLALAVAVVAVGAVLAVPAARTAVLEWLGLRGVAVERVETLPPLTVSDDLDLGERVTLEAAADRAPFPLMRPAALREPGEVHVTPLPLGMQVAFVWRDGSGDVEILLTQVQASLDRDFARKLAGPETSVRPTSVGDGKGLWLEGAPHAFAYVSPDGELIEETLRLARNTLLWERGGRTFRLEGDLDRARAFAIARSLRALGR